MLASLAIRRIGVIDEAVLEFGPGFTALTGETGAGKTMVVTGLSLLMGRRLDSRRAGGSSTVEGRVDAHSSQHLSARLDELGADSEDGEVLVVRRVTKEGRSRAHIGGVPVPVSTLADVVGSEITIHGQSDQLRLRDAQAQREALDSVLGEKGQSLLSKHRALFQEIGSLAAKRRALCRDLESADERKETLGSLLEAIEAAGTFEGEDDQLKAEIARLSNAADVLEAYDGALIHLVGDERSSVLTHLEEASGYLESLRGTNAADVLSSLLDRLTAIRDEITDIAREMSAGRDDSAASPGRLAEAQARLHELTTLLRDKGPQVGGASSITELLDGSRKALESLQALERGTEQLGEISTRLKQLTHESTILCEQITQERKKAADILARKVEDELAFLEMTGASIRIDVISASVGEHGSDQVSFTMQPHPGAEYLPLATGASGGELSRVMLALEVAMASLTQADGAGKKPVFIFDEIDAGIGGKAAKAVGERLAQLAQSAQVIVVTHLPQVASFATTHLRIVKETTEIDGVALTRSHVETLEDSDRIAELARMLAGDDTSETAREHARELIEVSSQLARGSAT